MSAASRVKLSCEEGGIAWITLSRPGARNALSRQLCADLLEQLDQLRVKVDSGSVRVAVIEGEGPAFCAGADLKERVGMTPDEVSLHSRMIADCASALAAAPCPVVAAMHGAVLGGGLELALAADIRIVADDAVLGFPEVTLGFFPGAGGPVRLVRLVGFSTATRLLMTGERISGNEAVRLHIAHEAVAASQLRSQAAAMAATLAGLPPAGVRGLRALLDLLDKPQAERGFALSRKLRDALNGSPT